MLQINSIFCGLTPLYYGRIMPEIFQKKFLGISMSALSILAEEIDRQR